MPWTEQRKRRPPQRITEAGLETAAGRYMQRFWGPAAALHRVLMKRIAASCTWYGEDPTEAKAMVEALIARLVDAGVLDDALVARERARVMHERGLPLRRIAQRLREKGLAATHIEAALATIVEGIQQEEGEEAPDADTVAAQAYARRRRLGPHRPPDLRAERRQKDLAALARAGFSFDIARRVIDGPVDGDPLVW